MIFSVIAVSTIEDNNRIYYLHSNFFTTLYQLCHFCIFNLWL